MKIDEVKLKLDYEKTKKLLDKLKNRWKDEKSPLRKNRIYKKIKVLSSRLVDIREDLAEFGIEAEPKSYVNTPNKSKDILNIKPAGSDKLNPDGTLPRINPGSLYDTHYKDVNDLVNNYKILPDGSLFSFDKIQNPNLPTVSG